MDPGAITARERSAFIALTALVFLYVLVRAAVVPLVHDEAASYLWFVEPGELIPFHAHWDANNHVVNTLCGWAADRLFGTSLLALRWGNVSAFLVFALATFRLGRNFTRPLVRWCCWAALLLCPFALDLFSLFRGYGIGLAGLLFAVERTITFCRSHRAGTLWSASVAMVVALYADLSLVPTALVLVGIAALGSWSAWRVSRARGLSALGALVFGGLASAYAVYLALLMQKLGLLYHGSLDGFIPVTVRSLCHYVLGTTRPAVVAAAVVIGAGTLIMAAAVTVRARRWNSALAVVFALLTTEVVARIVLGRFFGVHYPEDRAGVHLVPLFILCIALVADALAVHRPALRWGVLLLAVLPLRTLSTLNLDHTLLWPEQSVPVRFIATVAERQRHATRPLLIGGYHQLALCWPLGARLAHLSVPPLDPEGFPAGAHDLRIVDARFIDRARPGYVEIDHAEGPGLWLLERERPATLVPLDTFRVAGGHGDAEFMDLADPPLDALRAGELEADIRFGLDCPYPSLDVTLVTEVNDSTGTKLFYDAFSPLALRADWHGDTLHIVRRIPRCPGAARAVIYLYNSRRHPYTVTGPVVTIAAVRP